MIQVQIKSQSTQDKEYTITLAQDGFHCTCFSFIYSKAVPQTCKHIPEAYAILNERFRVTEQKPSAL